MSVGIILIKSRWEGKKIGEKNHEEVYKAKSKIEIY